MTAKFGKMLVVALATTDVRLLGSIRRVVNTSDIRCAVRLRGKPCSNLLSNPQRFVRERHVEGIMNTVVSGKVIPNHQGPNAQTVDPELGVVTPAVKASHDSNQPHAWWVELSRKSSRDEVLAAFHAVRRIACVRMDDGLTALNGTVELMLDLGRPRGGL